MIVIDDDGRGHDRADAAVTDFRRRRGLAQRQDAS
jgi:hypothetical protein